METNNDGTNAADALATIGATQAKLADRMITPWWYHPAAGLLIGGLIASQGLPSPELRSSALGALVLGTVLLVTDYRRRTGIWVGGLSAPAGRAYTYALVACIAPLFLVSVGLGLDTGRPWYSLTAGAAAVPVVIFLGRRWEAAIRAELRRPA